MSTLRCKQSVRAAALTIYCLSRCMCPVFVFIISEIKKKNFKQAGKSYLRNKTLQYSAIHFLMEYRWNLRVTLTLYESLLLLSRKSRWCAASGIRIAMADEDKLRNTPPLAHGSSNPLLKKKEKKYKKSKEQVNMYLTK